MLVQTSRSTALSSKTLDLPTPHTGIPNSATPSTPPKWQSSNPRKSPLAAELAKSSWTQKVEKTLLSFVFFYVFASLEEKTNKEEGFS